MLTSLMNYLKGKKTVIFNIAAATVVYGGLLPVDKAYWAVLSGNIVLRIITDGPETLLKSVANFLAGK